MIASRTLQSLAWAAPVGIVVMASWLGCDRHSPPSHDSSQTTVSSDPARPDRALSADLPRYEVRELRAIGPYLPDLDDERLRVAPPVDWYVVPRSSEYLVRFVRDRNNRSPLPRITMEVSPWEEERPEELDEQRVKIFRDMIAESLGASGTRALVEDVQPLVLGSIPCVRYVVDRQFQIGDKVIAGNREVIKTIQRGRLYTLYLDVYAGKLIDYRSDAYAVMANLQFLVPPGAAEEAAQEPGTGAAESATPTAPPDDARSESTEQSELPGVPDQTPDSGG